MSSLAVIAALAQPSGLGLLGALHPAAGDGAPPGCGTLVLLGPDGPEFWRAFGTSAEYRDGAPDPLDRWSERVVGALAAGLGAEALFPFRGPPWPPFTAWARRSGQAWTSPVGLLVHARLGLFVSYRGALALSEPLELPPAAARPCDACAKPCLDACPVRALTTLGYDPTTCRSWLDTGADRGCLECGCAVRRSCPVGRGMQSVTQSAFHMRAFHVRQEPCDG